MYFETTEEENILILQELIFVSPAFHLGTQMIVSSPGSSSTPNGGFYYTLLSINDLQSYFTE